MAEHSFDIVSKVDLQEVSNAIQQALKEISQRYDFRGSKSSIELDKGSSEIHLASDDEYKLKSVVDILQAFPGILGYVPFQQRFRGPADGLLVVLLERCAIVVDLFADVLGSQREKQHDDRNDQVREVVEQVTEEREQQCQ